MNVATLQLEFIEVLMFLPIVVARDRYEICKICDEFNSAVKLCKKCNCFMPAKITIARARCPLGKWGASTVEPTEPNSYEVED